MQNLKLAMYSKHMLSCKNMHVACYDVAIHGFLTANANHLAALIPSWQDDKKAGKE